MTDTQYVLTGRQSAHLKQMLTKLPALAQAAHEARQPALGQMANDIRVQATLTDSSPINEWADALAGDIISVIEMVLAEIELHLGKPIRRDYSKVGKHVPAAGISSEELYKVLTERVILIEIWCPVNKRDYPDFTLLPAAPRLYRRVRSVYSKAAALCPVPGVDVEETTPSRPCPLECGGRVKIRYRDDSTPMLSCNICCLSIEVEEDNGD